MNIATILVVFTIAWWLIFFILLPAGIQTQSESDAEAIPGTPESAPVNPRLWQKAGAASILAAIVTALTFWAITNNIVTILPT